MTMRQWAVLALISIFVGSPAVRGEDQPVSGAAWSSPETLIYLEVEHPKGLIDRISSDLVQKYLYSVPAYQQYVKTMQYQALHGLMEMVTGQLDTTWDDTLRKLTGGGLVLAIDATDGKPNVVLIATPSDPAFAQKSLDLLFKLAIDDAKNNGRPEPKEVQYRGGKGYVLSEQIVVGIYRDRLLVGNLSRGLISLIDRVENGSDATLINKADFKTRKKAAAAQPDQLAWGYVQLDELRKLDPKRFTIPDKLDAGQILLFGSWIETLKQAPWLGATLSWKDTKLAATLNLPTPPKGLSDSLKTYVPPKGQGASANLRPPGTIASLSLWRDLGKIWDVRNDLFNTEYVQSLSGLDTFAGQFFGAKDFGSGVLAALTSDWRLVVAQQDYANLKPSPDIKLPGFAIVIGLKEEDDEFAQRLKAGFQTFVGLANLGAAQNQYPPLELGTEKVDGSTIATAKFMPNKVALPEGTPVNTRYNISPSAVQVGNHFVISSTLSLARDLVKAIKSPTVPTDETLVIEADGHELSSLIQTNRTRLVMQNMIEKGNAKPASEGEIDTLSKLADFLGKARLTVKEGDSGWQMKLDFTLNPVK